MRAPWTFADAANAALPDGEVLLWWLGQAGFLLRGAGATLLVDPYLTPTGARQVPPPFPAADAVGVDAVLVTHEHGDHLDVDVARAFAEAGSTARWVVPEPVAGKLEALGIRRELIEPARPGRPVTIGAVRVDPLPAHHGIDMTDAYGTGAEHSGGPARFLGYVLDLGGTRIYHSGDCIDFPGLADELARLDVHVVLLPVNGRDAEREARGIVGNMSAEEAVDLAARAGAEVFVPMHWDMFAGNPGHPSRAVALVERDHPELAVLVPSRARPIGVRRFGPRRPGVA
ncbi:MBL fold metallo-hydrolase [Pseudonocardia sp. MH-G8]|uniref:MBL fold metallo-hydrolase n=1 Tax=Pseudonocardia sp. MH-G8 TaxID=1854588 RepID=UPI000B9FC8D7|nr:MBL fold metallo-hydrolase [Pseudonocardia sp. MH-G8]OZM75926.1 metal-dependent hydrolase [Pseudonocardia sp. MH-G8]